MADHDYLTVYRGDGPPYIVAEAEDGTNQRRLATFVDDDAADYFLKMVRLSGANMEDQAS